MNEVTVALATALVAAGAQLLREYFDRRRRRAGLVKTRRSDWTRTETRTHTVSIERDDDDGQAAANGHGDPRSPGG